MIMTMLKTNLILRATDLENLEVLTAAVIKSTNSWM
jgi:hypothetical protein